MTTPRVATTAELAMVPSRRRILRQQLESILGRIGLATIAAVVVVAALIGVLNSTDVIVRNDGAIGWALLPYFAIAQGIALVVALLFPGVVWQGLPPDRRVALHALPVNRDQHELLRVGAGALIVAAATFVLFGIALLLQVRLLPPSVPLPTPGAFLLAGGSLTVTYFLASLAGLLTRSAIGNVARVLIYGFFAGMLAALLSQRLAWVAATFEWVSNHIIGGRWGIGSAVLAGLDAFKHRETHPTAVVLWLLLATLLTGQAVGRLPRQGRG
ncbi:MAG: hypothetical protein V4558_09285 [Gemmatimonadota bacterium]